ncbi:MAG: protein kinase [Anaerolineales bacterium]|nr:protein kinase [Anaerolineales bacterium]
MNNPYISRGPVRESTMFFGRTHELNEITAFLRGNQSVSIVSPRKMGKTSLLYHMMRPEILYKLGMDEQFIFVYLDCEVLGEGSHEDIFAQFAIELSEALHERNLPPETVVQEAIDKPGRLAFERAVRRLNQRGLRVILLLDEFERLSSNASLDVNFFNALRSAAGRYQLAYVTASARQLIQLTYSGRSQEILSSPFFNIFAPLHLGLLTSDEAYTLIRQPSQAAGLAFTPQMQDHIYQYVGGHPLALQVACFHAMEHPKEPELVEQHTAEEMASHFQYYWHNLTPTEQATLRQVDEVAIRSSTDTTLRGILRDLVQKSMLISDAQGYHYPSRLWAEFVSAQQPKEAAPNALTTLLLTGTQFGHYEVLEKIGRGGMSEVYKGRHTRLDRIVAIKILPASLAAEVDFRNRFEREARAVAALRHPHIVQVYDFGDISGTYYMVMEYVAGKDLASAIREQGRLPLDQVIQLLEGVCGALDYAHGLGLVHRDVKPSNVLLQPLTPLRPADEMDSKQPPTQPVVFNPILTDFGIAKMLGGDTAATKTGLMMGTLNYMAPEQIRSAGEVDGRADIYALAVMTYQMLTGRLPFDADNPGAMMLAHLQIPPPDPRELIPELPFHVARAILRALEKEPQARFNTAGEFSAQMALGVRPAS